MSNHIGKLAKVNSIEVTRLITILLTHHSSSRIQCAFQWNGLLDNWIFKRYQLCFCIKNSKNSFVSSAVCMCMDSIGTFWNCHRNSLLVVNCLNYKMFSNILPNLNMKLPAITASIVSLDVLCAFEFHRWIDCALCLCPFIVSMLIGEADSSTLSVVLRPSDIILNLHASDDII